MPEAVSRDVQYLILDALKKKMPFSVVRIGDGEGNLLTFCEYPGDRDLDFQLAKQIIDMQAQTFRPDDVSLFAIKRLIYAAVCEADIVGVRGLASFRGMFGAGGRARSPAPAGSDGQAQDVRKRLRGDPRGFSGYWKSIDYLARMAERGVFRDKIVASAHLYFGFIENLDLFEGAVERLILLTNREEGARALIERIKPDWSLIVEVSGATAKEEDGPRFLYDVEQRLPMDLEGTLCLVGAGPWSEIYCSVIKSRGGVAVDIGSGFDLAEGKRTRPIHRQIGISM